LCLVSPHTLPSNIPFYFSLLHLPASCTAVPTTPQRPSNPSPFCFNLILSPTELAQRSIITRFDQNTTYSQQSTPSTFTQGFKDRTEHLGTSTSQCLSVFISTSRVHTFPFSCSQLQSTVFSPHSHKPATGPRISTKALPSRIWSNDVTFHVFTFL
jgi:hypothetical protein